MLFFSFSINRRDHVTPHYRHLEILKLEHRFCLLYSGFLFEIIKNNCPLYLYSLLKLRSSIHSKNLRNNNQFFIPQHKTNKFKSSFEYTAVILLNKYFNLFQNCHTSLTFKKKLRDTLLQDEK